MTRLVWFFYILFATPLADGTVLVAIGFTFAAQRTARNHLADLRANWRCVLPQFLSVPVALLLISTSNFYSDRDLLIALCVLVSSLVFGIQAIVRNKAIRPFAIGATALCLWLTLCMFAAGGELP